MKQIFISFLFTLSLAISLPVQALEGKVAAMAAPGTPWDKSWTIYRTYLEENAPTIKLDYFIRGELGNEDEQLKALRRNRVQIGGLSLQGLATVVPELTVAMAPYLFESVEEVDFVYDNYLKEPVARLLADKGLIFLQWTEVGWTDLYANKPVLLPSDAAGLKLRGAPNISAQVFLLKVGANSVPVGSVDLVPALQTGLVKGGTSNIVFHYYQTRAYASDVTLTHHSYDTGALVANKKWFDGATPEEQMHLRKAYGSTDDARQAVRVLVDGLIAKMREEGIAIHTLSEEQRAEWVSLTAPAVQDIIDEVGGEAALIYQTILDGKAAFKAAQTAE